MVNWKLKNDKSCRANIRSEFDGELPVEMEATSRKKSSGTLVASETKTSVMRQEMHGKGVKSKWSWKEREETIRELERKGSEQKKEIQKLKKQNETIKSELVGVVGKLASKEEEITKLLRSGHHANNEGNVSISPGESVIIKKKDEEIEKNNEVVDKPLLAHTSLDDSLKNSEEQKKAVSQKYYELSFTNEKSVAYINQIDQEKRASDEERVALESKSDFESKLLVEERNTFFEKEKRFQDELEEMRNAKISLESDIKMKERLIEEQIQKIDELLVMNLKYECEVKDKSDELTKSCEECNMLQEKNKIVEAEQELLISDMFSKLEEIMKIVQGIDLGKKTVDLVHKTNTEKHSSIFLTPGGKETYFAVDNDVPNSICLGVSPLHEELILSDDSFENLDEVSIKYEGDIISKFEEVRKLLLQKVGDIDLLVCGKELRIDKMRRNLEEWQTNCQNLEDELSTLKNEFENHLEIKTKENQELRYQNDIIKAHCSNTISTLDKVQQHRIADMENSDSYYRDKVETISNDLEKMTKQHEALLLENSETVKKSREEMNFVREEVVVKEKEIAEWSRKYDLLAFHHIEREKELREDTETYFNEEITRIKNDCKNKVKEVETERENEKIRLTHEYEDKILELEVEYDKLKSSDCQMIRDEFARQLQTLSVHCNQLTKDKTRLEVFLKNQKSAFEEELRNVKGCLFNRVKELDILKAKYEAQRHLVGFITTSLEQERAKKNNSNHEILYMLEKLEKQFSEAFSPSKESYQSSNGINSTKYDSISESYFPSNSRELNTTWPPKYMTGSLPVRKWASLGVLDQNPNRRKDLIEKLRSEISAQISGLNAYSFPSSDKAHSNKFQTSNWKFMSEINEETSVSQMERSGSISPSRSYIQSSPNISPLWNVHETNKISQDSGLDQNEELTELIGYPNQIHEVVEMLKKLEEVYDKIKDDNSGTIDRQWFLDLENWKSRVQLKLNSINTPLERSGSSVNSTISNKSIIFHPGDEEVKAIIENANKMYDNSHFVV